MSKRNTVHTLLLDHASEDVILSDLENAGHTVNVETVEPDSGGPYEEVSITKQIDEMFDATSPAVGTLLDILSLVQATCIGSGQTYTDMQLFGRQLDSCGTDGTASGSVHRKTNCTKVRLMITQITANGNAPVSVTLRGILLSTDGDTAPSTTVSNVALPTGGIANEFFKLHGIKLTSSITLDSDMVTSFTLDTGIRYQQAFGNKTYAQELIVTKTPPEITIETEDTEIVENIPSTGLAIGHANSLIEFRRFDPSTGFPYSTSASEHAVLTIAGIARTLEPFSGSGSNVATARIGIKLTGVAGTPPITASTGDTLTL